MIKKQKSSKNKKIAVISFVLIITLIILLWILTKATYISNYLGIKILWLDNNQNLEKKKEIKMINLEKIPRWCNGGFSKPVIYLYPTKKESVLVQLDYKWKIFADYPEYDTKIKGWQVIAYPDGKVIDLRDGKEYSYLFWEWIPSKKIDWDLSKGFVVKWKDTKKFLQKTLSQMLLTPREYNEFIVYWFPKMQNNKYNLIHFAGKKYTDTAPLNITPKPDSMLRVFMVYKPLDKPIKIQKQTIKHFIRKGFTVIEWGGSELK